MAYTYSHAHRVRYRECDPMGVVYHTHYLDYFEVARTEALRHAGVRYRDLEANGIIMPVVHVEVDYHGPAHYDDPLVVDAHFTQMPTVRVPIDYTVYREGDDDVLVTGHTTLCFTDAEVRRPTSPPEAVHEAFAPLLEE
ncbi:acyl-CoA thioesterase [Salinibacter ruber]|jgi:acyl-CoA thioester hydrolase|uniref:acyl-CoA thioesterase n=1 Tax=Salinibacter ruber TaxID=146919 RepID=UPI000E6CAFA5|nr:thioesterase family protein [Salinibacter ruber]MCS4195539.1 acyl-CoA thioester hydrolase [Salinibacter ruber]